MTTRCGFAAIIGAPNAGKSTLINALVGSKVAIVTPKVQTTRMPVRGIAMAGETQIVFVDTPGIFRPRRRLDRAMVSSAWAGAEDADALLLIVDAADLVADQNSLGARDTRAILEGLREGKAKKKALILNKIDGMKRTDLLPLVERFHAEGVFEDIFGPQRRRRSRCGELGGGADAGRALALSRRPGRRYPLTPSGRRGHARENLSAPA